MEKVTNKINEYKIIEFIKNKYPDHFLCVILHKEENGEIIPIGLFKCMKCHQPIHHRQFNFARCCASCDIGKDNPKWGIIKPEDKTPPKK